MTSTSQQISGIQRTFYITGSIVFIGIVLYVGSPLFIPLAYALFISFIIQPFCVRLEKKGLNRGIAIIIPLVILTVAIGLLLFVLYTQFVTFTRDWNFISTKLKELLENIKFFLITDLGFQQQQVEKGMADLVGSTMSNLAKMLQSSILSFFVNVVILFLIPIYAFLILYSRRLLVDVLYSLFPESERVKIAQIIALTVNTYYNFIKGMAVVYFTVGILNSIGLLLLGVPHAFLFGFLTAIMTFIPYVGIIVASLLPITYSWITYNSIWYPIGVIAIFTFVQYLEANIIFPWAVSQKLHLNTLVTLAVIVVGGILWGASGMILFIPFAAILKLIADKMEGWEPLSRFLGKD
jgi:predicted PurR-regulated permease PerM